MPRVKRGVMTRKRHRRVLTRAKGYWGARHRWFKMAHEAVMHAAQYAYRDRRVRKRNFRKLWIARINAACRANGMTYSRFINGMSRAGITLDRKVMSDMAINDPAAFATLVERASAALAS
jgi:large subunit ribosomal protein L20